MHEIPLQIDLFTGEKVDRRTRGQKERDRERQIPTQLLMFSQRDIAQPDVNPYPRMDLSLRLTLMAEEPEDTRTEEEIEQDLMRQAQANTRNMFAGALPANSPPATPTTLPAVEPTLPATATSPLNASLSDDEANEAETPLTPEPPLTQWVAYLALVNAAQEQAATLSTTPASALSESISMNLAKLDARHAGLTGDEINAALTIGAYRGRAMPPITSSEIPTPAEELPEKAIPILWTTKADMLKRRPDLAAKLEQLRDDEVEALAALVGEALQEFYWIQLNVVLSLFVDQDLPLMRTVRKLPKSDTSAP